MSKDVDQSYAETGEQLNDPIDTFEKIYLIVRNISDRNVKVPYELKKHDIIKLGRVKFKVRQIYIQSREDARQQKRQTMSRRESAWRRKEIQRLENQKKKMENRRMNSDNLQQIQKMIEKELAKSEGKKSDQEDHDEFGINDDDCGKAKHDLIKNELLDIRQKPIKIKSMSTRQPANPYAYEERLDGLQVIPEAPDKGERSADSDDEHEYQLPQKPSYFSKYDDVLIDSEDELVSGENNYIGVKAVPIHPPASPEQSNALADPAPNVEESKEVASPEVPVKKKSCCSVHDAAEKEEKKSSNQLLISD